MNIGIFTDTYKPQINGVVTSICALEKELTEMGHRVYIFTTTDPNEKRKIPRVFRLPSFPFMFMPAMRFTFFYPPKLLLKLKKLRLDIVHTQTEFSLGLFGLVVSEFYKLPRVHTYHTMYEEYVHYILQGRVLTKDFAKAFSRVFCNAAGLIITPAEKSKTFLESYGVTRPIRVIPTGFDLTQFADASRQCAENAAAKARLKHDLGIGEGDPVIVCVSRIAKEKNIDMLIAALPELLKTFENLKFVIVGDGPYLNGLISYCGILGVTRSVVFAGAKPWSEIAKYYAIGDVFAVASTSETQGLTIMEAMAAHVPVVARYDASFGAFLTDGVTGYTYAGEDDCAQTLIKALKADNAKITEAAWRVAQNHTAGAFAESVLSVYDEALQNKPSHFINIRIPLVFKKAGSFVLDLKNPGKIISRFNKKTR